MARDAKLGKRVADRWMRVRRKYGAQQWLLIYIEVRAYYDAGFETRMVIYHYRLVDRHQRPIVSRGRCWTMNTPHISSIERLGTKRDRTLMRRIAEHRFDPAKAEQLPFLENSNSINQCVLH